MRDPSITEGAKQRLLKTEDWGVRSGVEVVWFKEGEGQLDPVVPL